MTQAIDNYIKEHSRLAAHRPYLGMSGINNCPRLLYDRFLRGTEPTDFAHRKSYQGYFYESEVKKILEATGNYRKGSERELLADWDPRFRGHIDGEDLKGELIEIKNMHPKTFEETIELGRLRHPIYWQVQAYLHHGNYNYCTVWIVNTDVFKLHPIRIDYNSLIVEKLEARARLVLQAIDAQLPPACVCGRCNPVY